MACGRAVPLCWPSQREKVLKKTDYCSEKKKGLPKVGGDRRNQGIYPQGTAARRGVLGEEFVTSQHHGVKGDSSRRSGQREGGLVVCGKKLIESSPKKSDAGRTNRGRLKASEKKRAGCRPRKGPVVGRGSVHRSLQGGVHKANHRKAEPEGKTIEQ